MRIIAKLKNFPILNRQLRKIHNNMGDIVIIGMDRGLNRLADYARILAPRDRGQLRASITHEIEAKKTRVVGRYGTNLKYGIFVEKGTGIHGEKGSRIYPKKKKALAWVSVGLPPKTKAGWQMALKAGRAIIVKSTTGMKERPFLEPSLDKGRDEFMSEFIGAINEGLPKR